MFRTTRRHQVAHADEVGVGMLSCRREKLRQVLREMLAVRVHRDGVGEAEFFRAKKSRPQRRCFTAVRREPHHIAAKQRRQLLRRAIIHHDHWRVNQRSLRHCAHSRGVIETGNDNARFHA